MLLDAKVPQDSNAMDQDPQGPRPEPGSSSNASLTTGPTSQPTSQPESAIMVLDSPTPMLHHATADSEEECGPNSADQNPLRTAPAHEPESSSDSDMPHAEFSTDSESPRGPGSPARRRCGRKGKGQVRCCSFCDSLQQSVRDLESLVAQLQDQLEELQRGRVEEGGSWCWQWRNVNCAWRKS